MTGRLYKGDVFEVLVLDVKDGDTVVLDYLGITSLPLAARLTNAKEVRLHGIDAPENGQPYGDRATDFLSRLALAKTFFLEVTDTSDAFGRVVGVLYEKARSDSVNRRVVAAGLAYNYTDFGELEGVRASEESARSLQLGVWKQRDGGVRPWEYREMRRSGEEVPASKQEPTRIIPTPRDTKSKPSSSDTGCLGYLVLIAAALFVLVAVVERCLP